MAQPPTPRRTTVNLLTGATDRKLPKIRWLLLCMQVDEQDDEYGLSLRGVAAGVRVVLPSQIEVVLSSKLYDGDGEPYLVHVMMVTGDADELQPVLASEMEVSVPEGILGQRFDLLLRINAHVAGRRHFVVFVDGVEFATLPFDVTDEYTVPGVN